MTEPSMLLTLIGSGVIAMTVGLLIWGKFSPIIPMTLVPSVGALLVGYAPGDIADFFAAGIDQVIDVVLMLIFAIMFFGVMMDSGLFAPIIRRLILLTRGHVVAVTIGTALIAVVAHIDGAGASTFLITIPALLPLYKALNMSRYLLLLMVVMSAGIFNMIPWGGPLGRAASVLNMNPIDFYQPLIVIQGIAVVLIIAFAAFFGFREQRRINVGLASGHLIETENFSIRKVADDFTFSMEQEREALGEGLRQGRVIYWLNFALVVAVISTIMSGYLPPALTFLLGVSVAMLLNFRSATLQMDRVKAHAPAALLTVSILLAAAVFLGVLNETGMLEAVAQSLLSATPEGIAPYVHLIVGYLGLPMELVTSTDAYYFSLLPLVESTAGHYGVPSTSSAYAMMIGNVSGTYVSPFAAGTWLAVGLAGANMGKHIRYSFIPLWLFSTILLSIAIALGVVAI